jgi:hypothetical protein
LELRALIRDEFGRIDQKRAKLLLDKIDAFTASTYSTQELAMDEITKSAPSDSSERDVLLHSIKVIPKKSNKLVSERPEVLWSAIYALFSDLTFDSD